jgi:hypothetical protein
MAVQTYANIRMLRQVTTCIALQCSYRFGGTLWFTYRIIPGRSSPSKTSTTIHHTTRRHIENTAILNYIRTKVMHKFLIYVYIYFCLTCFGLSFSPSSEAGVQIRQWFKSHGYGISDRTLTPYPGDLNHCRNCTPASEDGLKESPKHVGQK